MVISALPDSLAMVIRANHNLLSYTDRLLLGQHATPHSWLYENEDAQTTLERWVTHLRALERGNQTEKWIYDFDCKQLEKFGQQGGFPPITQALKTESFISQFDSPDIEPEELPELADVLGLRKHSLQYRPLTDVVDDMASRGTLATNSGWPYFTKRDTVKDLSIAEAQSGACLRFPAIILFRTYNGKLRAVWMYPMSMNLFEYQASQPLQELIASSTQYVTPWKGFEHVKRRFTELWSKHPFAFGGDTTAMDAHMRAPQIDAVARAVSSLFPTPEPLLTGLNRLTRIPIVIGPKMWITDPHGIASGSGWTQETETIFQILLFYLYLQQKGSSQTIEDGMGIGDDYVWFLDEQPNSEEIVAFWERNGLPGKPEKQSNDPNKCTFLQRLFIKGWMSREDENVLGGVYPTIRALNSLLWPERYHNPKYWNSDMFCLRCYMILENVVDHPMFEEFVRFVVAGQRDLIPFARASSGQFARIQRQARLLPGLVPTYNQEKRGMSLENFQSIRIARAL